jgi:hypothetical protein
MGRRRAAQSLPAGTASAASPGRRGVHAVIALPMVKNRSSGLLLKQPDPERDKTCTIRLIIRTIPTGSPRLPLHACSIC